MRRAAGQRTTDHPYVGREFTVRSPGGPRAWTHGRCVSVTPWGNDRIRWVRLRFPDHTEKSFAPRELLAVIPY